MDHRKIILIGMLLLSATSAQRPGYKMPPWQRKRMFSVSTESPILRHMIQQKGFNESVSKIRQFVSHIENNILQVLRRDLSPRPDMLFRPCGMGKQYPGSIRASFGGRGLPKIVTDCVTDMYDTQLFDNEVPQFQLAAVFEAATIFVQLLTRERQTIVEKTLRHWPPLQHLGSDWENVSLSRSFNLTRDNIKCQATLVSLTRVNYLWYLTPILTNVPNTFASREYMRQNLQESIFIDHERVLVLGLKQIIPKYTSDPKDGPPVKGTTTMFNRWSGTMSLGGFKTLVPLQNPAVLDSMEKAQIPTEQASASLLPSSMLIIFLPAILNLFPLGLITRMNRRVLVLTVISDMLTAIPMLVKGTELIVISRQRFRSIVTRIHGDMRGLRGNAAAGEMWVSECQVNTNVFPVGVALVCTAVAMVLISIWLEIWSMGFVTRGLEIRALLRREYAKIGTDEDYSGEAYIATLARNSSQSQ